MFDTAPHSLSAPLLQSQAFARALTATGLSPRRLADDTLVMTRRLPGGMRVSQIQRADLDPARLPLLIKDAELNRRLFLLRPEHPCPSLKQIGAVRLSAGHSVYELPLDSDPSPRLSPRFRHHLAHAKSQGMQLRRCNMPMDPGHWIFDRSDRNHHAQSAALLTLAFAAANPGAAKLFTASTGKSRVAALLILVHGEIATLHLARTTPHGVARGADYQLLWDAMNWLSSEGVCRLDLGPVAGRAAHDTGLLQDTGALPRTLGGTWGWWPPLAHRRWTWRTKQPAQQTTPNHSRQTP